MERSEIYVGLQIVTIAATFNVVFRVPPNGKPKEKLPWTSPVCGWLTCRQVLIVFKPAYAIAKAAYSDCYVCLSVML